MDPNLLLLFRLSGAGLKESRAHHVATHDQPLLSLPWIDKMTFQPQPNQRRSIETPVQSAGVWGSSSQSLQ